MTSENPAGRGGSTGVNAVEGDETTAEYDAFEALKLLLEKAFSTGDCEYELVSAEDIRSRVLVALSGEELSFQAPPANCSLIGNRKELTDDQQARRT